MLRLLKQIITRSVIMTPQRRPGKKPAIIALVGKDGHFGVKLGEVVESPARDVASQEEVEE